MKFPFRQGLGRAVEQLKQLAAPAPAHPGAAPVSPTPSPRTSSEKSLTVAPRQEFTFIPPFAPTVDIDAASLSTRSEHGSSEHADFPTDPRSAANQVSDMVWNGSIFDPDNRSRLALDLRAMTRNLSNELAEGVITGIQTGNWMCAPDIHDEREFSALGGLLLAADKMSAPVRDKLIDVLDDKAAPSQHAKEAVRRRTGRMAETLGAMAQADAPETALERVIARLDRKRRMPFHSHRYEHKLIHRNVFDRLPPSAQQQLTTKRVKLRG